VGLTVQALEVLSGWLHGSRVLSLGYPDLVMPADEVKRILGVEVSAFTGFGRWHGVDHPLPETVAVFNAIGASLDCVDVSPSRGVERIVDLNLPCELGRYDVVIDAGTVEHCFNIGQAIMNAAGAVDAGGCVFHMPPLSMANHGFYNLNPTLLHDFYAQNGWDIEVLEGVTRQGRFKVPPAARFIAPGEASLLFLASRRVVSPLRFPTQSKYLRNPGLS
jgi:hypothetical protein